ncbi:LysR family transcriptional regulator substrate-binding protein [Herbiconiux liukaitaii]|uniref:LysR family transcriptional regulator substrate-binding protein n=1 Tax=Herbiconiux liukaitaii TaxID=3342799 RepID=UPI0035B933F2
MALRVAFAPGVTPSKWFGVWSARMPDEPLEVIPLESVPTATADAIALLLEDAADVALVRLPLPASAPDDAFRSIPLYTELPVVVLPKDHELTLLEQVSDADIAEIEQVEVQAGRTPLRALAIAAGATGGADAVELVTAGVGYLVVPKSVARLHSRKDVVARDFVPAEGDSGEQRVALVWRADVQSPEVLAAEPERWRNVDEFIGVVRGRTANSTRGADTVEAIEAAKKLKPTAVAKAKAAEARAAKAKSQGSRAKKKPAAPGRTRPRRSR